MSMNLRCSFRFLLDSFEKTEEFKAEYLEYNITCRRYFKDKTKYAISVNLSDDINLEPLEKYVINSKMELNHNFFISVSTESDSEIIDVPNFVVECIRNIGGGLVFSFTCIWDE